MLSRENLNYKSIINYLKRNISEERLAHSIRVLEEMKNMSEIYDINIKDAQCAALFHDSFKEKPIDFLISYISRYEILPQYEVDIKINLHGIAAALFLYKDIGYKNKDVYNSIRYHTTGRPNMSNLEMGLYLADVIEEKRSFPGIDLIREDCKISLEKGMLSALNKSIEFLIKSNKDIHLDTVKARNFYNRLEREALVWII